MTTIINNSGESGEGPGVGLAVGTLLAVVLVGAFVIWGLPILRADSTPAAESGGVKVDVNLPSGGGAEQPQ